MTIKRNNGASFGYSSYQFRKDEQDPIVDKIRTIFEDHGKSIGDLAHGSGISNSTIRNWFSGKTKRPQFATAAAAVRTMGYDFILAPVVEGADKDAHTVATIIKRFPSARDRAG